MKKWETKKPYKKRNDGKIRYAPRIHPILIDRTQKSEWGIMVNFCR